MVPPNTQLMGVQQSHQGEKINNTYIYTHFYSAISFKVPLLLIKETVQTKQPCDPLPGTEKSRRGRLQPVAAHGAAEMLRHLEKKPKQTPPKELEFYFQSRKRLYFRVVTQYLLQPQRMLTERVGLLAVRGAGAGSAATRWPVFGDQRGLGQYIEPWHMGTAVTGPGASQGHCSAGSTQELHWGCPEMNSALKLYDGVHTQLRWLRRGGKGWPVGGQRAALTPKSGAKLGVVSPWQGTGGVSAPQPDLLDVVLREFPVYTHKVCSGMMSRCFSAGPAQPSAAGPRGAAVAERLPALVLESLAFSKHDFECREVRRGHGHSQLRGLCSPVG